MDYGKFVSSETDSRFFERVSYHDGEYEVFIKDDAMITFIEYIDPILDCEPINSLSENKRILVEMFKEECIEHSAHYPAIKLEDVKFGYDGESAVFFQGRPFNIKYIDLLISINQTVFLVPSKISKSLIFYTPNMDMFGKIMSMSTKKGQ